ncbi:hypothetical protein [Microbacterium lacus]|uniref:hypothetical protein n=1 Tax=Microbacterium lacus TaxID=415217 RepID=UPI0018E28B66|nr:hypothetical protein [Microbacterium lacus]
MTRKKKVPRGNPAARVIVYHYTHESHMPSILQSGVIRLTESNVSFEKAHAGPDVVWLTTDPELLGSVSSGLRYASGDSKAQVRITVSLPRHEVHTWGEWARKHGSSERALTTLAAAGGASKWRVIERPIERHEWVSVDRASDGRSK